jgi:transcriptional regulator with XRE-family HTH domain
MTPFGLFMRKLRLENGLLLKDMAETLDVSSAYLSALEHGKKGAPSADFVSALENKLKLDAARRDELRRSVRDSATNLAIPPKSTPLGFQTAHAFARKLPSLSEKQLRQMLKIVDQEDKDE